MTTIRMDVIEEGGGNPLCSLAVADIPLEEIVVKGQSEPDALLVARAVVRRLERLDG